LLARCVGMYFSLAVVAAESAGRILTEKSMRGKRVLIAWVLIAPSDGGAQPCSTLLGLASVTASKQVEVIEQMIKRV